MLVDPQAKRPLESQDGYNSLEHHQDEANTATISLQEQIELEEIVLKALLERRGQLAQQLASEEQKCHRWQAQTVVLQERKVTLQEAHTKHSSLRTELQESLQKSREKLSKLEKIEAVTENQILIPTSSNTNTTGQELTSEILLDDTVESDVAILEETNTTTTTTASREEEAESNDTIVQTHQSLRVPLLGAFALHEYHGKRQPDKNTRSKSDFLPFLSMVNSKLVSKIMGHYRMEPMVLPNKEVKIKEERNSSASQDSSRSSNHSIAPFASERALQESTLRRGLLRNTCLDFLILQSQTKDDCDPQEINSKDNAARREDFRTSSEFPEVDSATASSTATTPASPLVTMDPNIPLCPYELAGICADEYCPYQHTDPNRKSILPRELLPLPPLKLLEEDTTIKTERIDSKPTQPRANEESSSEMLSTTTEECLASEPAPKEEESDQKKTDETNGEEEEFITLPGMEEEDDDDDDEDMDIDESSSEEDKDEPIVESSEEKQKKSTTFWWWSNKEIPDWSHDFPLEDVLATLGGVKSVGGSETIQPQIEVTLPKNGSSKREWIGWLGRMVGCCQMATHAGRHDLALGIESILVSSTNDNEHAASQLEETAKLSVRRALAEHELASLVQVLQRIREVAVPCDSLPCSVFQQAFTVHLSFAVLSEYLKALWHAENNPTGSDDELQQQGDSWRSIGALLETIDLLLCNDPIPSSEAGGDDPEEGLKGLFEPNNSPYENLKDIVRFAVCTSTTLRSTSIPISRLEDSLLKPVWSAVTAHLKIPVKESTSIHYLTSIALMGFVMLSCLERFAAHVERGKDVLSQSLMAALTSLDSSIQQILKSLRKRVFEDAHLFNLTLAPLVAASVASACFLRQYSNAQNRLTTVMLRNQLSRSKWMQYSDLLWSQLVHLRMSLPMDSSEMDGNALKTVPEGKGKRASATEKDDLADLMETIGVRLNHICLIGDWNFKDLENRSDKEVEQLPTASEVIRRLILNPGSVPIGSKFIDLDNVEFGSSIDLDRVDGSKRMTSPLPRSILLASQCAQLSLQKCKLESLPPSFGLDFTNVIRLDVSYNSLHRLPVSIASMKNLEELHLGYNLLTDLPELPGSSLRLLNVSHNRLSTFPAFLLPDTPNGESATGRNSVPKRKKMRLRVENAKAPCSFQQLEVLVLAHNCLDQMEHFHLKLILNLKHLRRLQMEPQSRSGGYS